MPKAKIITVSQNPTTVKVLKAMYILNFCALLFPLCAVISVVLAYVFMDDATSYLKSHFEFVTRTFWIGLVYFVIAGLLWVIVIGMILTAIALIWWIVRNAKGLKAALAERPMTNVETWGF